MSWGLSDERSANNVLFSISLKILNCEWDSDGCFQRQRSNKVCFMKQRHSSLLHQLCLSLNMTVCSIPTLAYSASCNECSFKLKLCNSTCKHFFQFSDLPVTSTITLNYLWSFVDHSHPYVKYTSEQL